MEYAVQEILIMSVVGYGFAGSMLATDTFVGAHPDIAFAVFSDGADIGILEGGMKKLSSTLDDAKGGSDSAIETFKRLGVSVADLSTMSQEDMFGTVISALQEMPESAERTAIASDLLGRSAME